MTSSHMTPRAHALRAPEPQSPAIRHVLVCLDRSPFSDACLPYARFIAEAFKSKITLLHVLRSSTGAQDPGRPDALEWEIAKREAAHHLREAQESLEGASDEILTRLEQGSPAQQIVAAGREPSIDLTIMARCGESGAESAPDLGSIAQHVLAFAAGSVLLTHPSGTAFIPPRRILVPLDGSVRSESVLPIVAGLAALHNATVILAHVVREPSATAMLSDPDDMRIASSLVVRFEANAGAYLDRIRARLLPQVTTAETFIVRRPEERQALLDVAAQVRADLIVVAAHGATCNLQVVFGSVASYLLAHSKLPIFVVQDLPRGANEPAQANGRSAFGSRPPESD